MMVKTYKRGLLAVLAAVIAVVALCAGVILPAAAEAVTPNADQQTDYEQKVGLLNPNFESKWPKFLKGASDELKTQVKTKFQKAYTDMMEAGFNMGRVAEDGGNYGIRDWKGANQEFREGDHKVTLFGRAHGMIVMGSINAPAAAIVNELFYSWANGNDGTWGYPVTNRFKVTGETEPIGKAVWYQNFSKGYVRYEGIEDSTYDRSDTVNFVRDKKIDASGNVTKAEPIATVVGKIGDTLPAWAAGCEDEVTAAFEKAYNDIKTTDLIKQGGYDIGVSVDDVTLWRSNNVALTQTFQGGENTGDPYSWGAQSRIMMNDGLGKAYAVVGEILSAWGSDKYRDFAMAGYPMSNQFKYGDKLYQVFSGLVLEVDDMGIVEKAKYNVGELSSAVAKDKQAASFSTGFKNAYKMHNNYNDNLGIPNSQIVKTDGIYRQEYVGGAYADSSYIMQTGPSYRAHIVLSDAVAAIKAAGGFKTVGGPLSEAFEAGGKTYQNFKNGYVNITDKKFTKNKKMGVDGNEISLTANVIPEGTGATDATSNLPSGSFWSADGISAAFTAAAEKLVKSGYNLGQTKGKAVYTAAYINSAVENLKYGAVYQVFEDTSSSLAYYKGAKRATVLLMATPFDTEAIVLRDQFLEVFNSKASEYNVLEDKKVTESVIAGVPLGNEFYIGTRVYQNFTNGYVCVEYSHKPVYFNGFNAFTDGTFTIANSDEKSDGVPEFVGAAGEKDGHSSIPNDMLEDPDALQKIKTAFANEYGRLLANGFFPGRTDGEKVHAWAAGSFTGINQTFFDGDSNAVGYGNAYASMKIFMFNLSSPAYSLYSEMYTAWMKNGDISKVGYPMSNQFWDNGNLYQNFYSGYIKLTNGDPNRALFVVGKEYKAGDDSNGMDNGTLTIILCCTIIPVVVIAAGAVLLYLFVFKRKRGGKGGSSDSNAEASEIKEDSFKTEEPATEAASSPQPEENANSEEAAAEDTQPAPAEEKLNTASNKTKKAKSSQNKTGGNN